MIDEIANWLDDQHSWVQEAAHRLLANGVIDDADISAFVDIIKRPEETRNTLETSSRSYPAFGVGSAGSTSLRLKSIGNISGIDRLAPKNPLEFSSENLTVIYGSNGSGKSGYARILKKACGKSGCPDLKPNVFMAEPSLRECTISFIENDVVVDRKWEANSSPVPELIPVDIFDSATGRLYIDSETEISFTPPELTFLSELVEIYKRVEARFTIERDGLPNLLPQIPSVHQATTVGKQYSALGPNTSDQVLSQLYPWTEQNEAKLSALLAEKAIVDPLKEAQRHRTLKYRIDAIRDKLRKAREAVTAENCAQIFALVQAAEGARQTSVEGTAALTKTACLNGIGTKTWRTLWEAAKQYSFDEAYSNKPFPNLEVGAKCVLCQQDLDTAAKQRLADFEGFVTGILEVRAAKAESNALEKINALPDGPDEDSLSALCQAAGLSPEFAQSIKTAWADVDAIVNILRSSPLVSAPAGIEIVECPLISELDVLSAAAESETQKFEELATNDIRDKTEAEIRELEAKKWTSIQKDAIDAEIARSKSIMQIAEWTKQTATNSLSLKAGDLSKTLITKAYVERFNSELKKLGAARIQVELVKSRVEVGQVKHKIQLRGIKNHKAGEILSEGEHRIVSLAGFLASVTAKAEKAPFVFDDPVSSLDQDYEEKTLNRLIELSLDRQVIILTHRLSLLGFIDEKAIPQIVTICQEHWGTGQPSELSILEKKPEGALKKLRNERLAQAKKALENDGKEAYYPLAKAICSDVRILVERIIETVFLADVIQRWRRSVKTQGKVMNLSKITGEDCQLVDRFMTAYSCYEHSQPIELPGALPTPDELADDLDKLIAWLDEFKVRKVT